MTAASIERAWKRWPSSFTRFMAHLDRRQVAYLSHSKVSQVERCPQCYLNQYVFGHQPRSDALTTGNLFHVAARALYEARRTGRPLTSASVARALRPKHPAPEQRRFLANAMKTLRHNVWDGHYEVVAVEEPLFLDLASNIPPVIGQVDLVLRQGGSYTVVDHKTSGKFADCDCGHSFSTPNGCGGISVRKAVSALLTNTGWSLTLRRSRRRSFAGRQSQWSTLLSRL